MRRVALLVFCAACAPDGPELDPTCASWLQCAQLCGFDGTCATACAGWDPEALPGLILAYEQARPLGPEEESQLDAALDACEAE